MPSFIIYSLIQMIIGDADALKSHKSAKSPLKMERQGRARLFILRDHTELQTKNFAKLIWAYKSVRASIKLT